MFRLRWDVYVTRWKSWRASTSPVHNTIQAGGNFYANQDIHQTKQPLRLEPTRQPRRNHPESTARIIESAIWITQLPIKRRIRRRYRFTRTRSRTPSRAARPIIIEAMTFSTEGAVSPLYERTIGPGWCIVSCHSRLTMNQHHPGGDPASLPSKHGLSLG